MNKTNYTRQKAFHSEGGAGVNGISAKIETYRVTKVKMCLVKYEDYEEIFFLLPDVSVAVLVCLRFLLITKVTSHETSLQNDHVKSSPE